MLPYSIDNGTKAHITTGFASSHGMRWGTGMVSPVFSQEQGRAQFIAIPFSGACFAYLDKDFPHDTPFALKTFISERKAGGLSWRTRK